MKKKNGFTFVELMVVMAIVGIIFVISSVSFVGVSRNSRDARRKADLESLRQALELCRSYSGSYPTGVVAGGSIVCNSVTYMSRVPSDPKTGLGYTYTSSGTPPVSYTLSATLEIDGSTYSVTNP